MAIWKLETGEIVATFGADSPAYQCAVAPDGVTIAAGDAQGYVHFLRLERPLTPAISVRCPRNVVALSGSQAYAVRDLLLFDSAT